MSTRIVEVFADASCPFAHVGLVRFVQRRDELGLDVVLRVRAWPLELVNGEPLDPRIIGEEVAAIRAQVAPDLFAGFDVDAFPATSLPAMALTSAAYAIRPEIGERVALALRWELFEHGRDISRPDVLLDVAQGAHIGLPQRCEVSDVRDEWAEGQRRGVVGSPHFFVGRAGFFCPGLDISSSAGRFEIASSRARFDAFIERAVAA